jgi:hypothetical protein
MPKSGLSGSVRGAPSNGRPYRDTPRKPHMSREQSSGSFLGDNSPAVDCPVSEVLSPLA